MYKRGHSGKKEFYLYLRSFVFYIAKETCTRRIYEHWEQLRASKQVPTYIHIFGQEHIKMNF